MKCIPRHRAGAALMRMAAIVLLHPAVPALGQGVPEASARAAIRTAPTPAHAGFDAGAWVVEDQGQLALTGAMGGSADVFAGIQCDPFVPKAHRLILGVVQPARQAAARDFLHGPDSKLTISTDSASIVTRFELALEDRGQSNFRGKSEFAAAYLNQQQFDAIHNARSFVIAAGGHSYRFDGQGSARAIRALTCRNADVHIASRLIEQRKEDMPPQKLGSWHLAAAGGRDGSGAAPAEAFAVTSNHPANPDARFRLGVRCVGGQLYAHFKIDDGAKPGAAGARAASDDFSKNFERQDKIVDVYRAGHLLTTFLVGGQANRAVGHALSDHDIASMIESDELAVVGDHTVITFSTANAPQSLASISRKCNRFD